MNSRLILIFIGLTVLWSLVFMRAAQIQLLPDHRLSDLRRRQYKTLIELPARRGLILDRAGKELAVTIPAYSIFADPKEVDQPKKFARVLGKKLGFSPKYISNRIRDKDRRFVWIKRGLKKEVVDDLRAQKLRGLGVIEEAERVYPNEKLLSQVLGFVGTEGGGLEGLELQYDRKLRAENRKIKVERDARGRPLLLDGRAFTDIPAGHDLKLTIDRELQFRLERELAQAVNEYEAESATGIILDAQTSEILAMGNAPTFDPNYPERSDKFNFRNRAVTDAFEPGSTVKPLVIAGALKNGTIKPNSKFFCENGSYKIGTRTIHEAETRHTFGDLTVTEILAHSSNIGVAKIAFKMGDQSVAQTLKDFGLGAKTGVDLPGESNGVLQSLPWREHLLSNISFGHGMTTTPLQLATAYAAIANGGELRAPYIVKEMNDQETGEKILLKPQPVRRILTGEQAATMRLMLSVAASDAGTGKAAQVPGFPVAGKTGTAQRNVPGRGYVPGEYISSFAGFIPANDPKYVIYVAIDNPKNRYYGAEVAAPLFSRIAGYAVRVGGIAPVLISEKSVLKKAPADVNEEMRRQSLQKIRDMAQVMAAEEHNVTPDLKGLTLREVYNRVRGTPIKVEVHGRGSVAQTTPGAGESLPENKKIKIYLEK